MNSSEYIASGNLEAYCLGNLTKIEEAQLWELCRLFPQVQLELQAVERSLEKLAKATAVTPSQGCKTRLLASLGFEALDLNALPIINKTSNYLDWLEAFTHLIPEQPKDELVFHPLTRTFANACLYKNEHSG